MRLPNILQIVQGVIDPEPLFLYRASYVTPSNPLDPKPSYMEGVKVYATVESLGSSRIKGNFGDEPREDYRVYISREVVKNIRNANRDGYGLCRVVKAGDYFLYKKNIDETQEELKLSVVKLFDRLATGGFIACDCIVSEVRDNYYVGKKYGGHSPSDRNGNNPKIFRRV